MTGIVLWFGHAFFCNYLLAALPGGFSAKVKKQTSNFLDLIGGYVVQL